MRKSPEQHTIAVDGADIVVFEWAGQALGCNKCYWFMPLDFMRVVGIRW